MKITLTNPSVLVALGEPSLVTFEVNACLLRVFNETGAFPSERGARWLRSLAADLSPGGKLTMAHVKAALS